MRSAGTGSSPIPLPHTPRWSRVSEPHGSARFTFARRVLGSGAAPRTLDPWLQKLAWTGTGLILALVVTLFIAWRATAFFSGERPPLILLGWGTLQKAPNLLGPPMLVLRVNLGFLSFALFTALVTRGFKGARIWGGMASGLIGLAGAVAGIPLLVILSVLLLNLILWTLLCILTCLTLLLWVPIVVLHLLRR